MPKRIEEEDWLEQLRLRDNEIHRLNTAVSDLINTVQDFEVQLSEKCQYTDELEESLALLDDQLQALTAREQELEQEMVKLKLHHQRELEQQEAQHKINLQRMTEDIHSLKSELSHKIEEIRGLEDLVNDLDSQLLDLKLQDRSNLADSTAHQPSSSQLTITEEHFNDGIGVNHIKMSELSPAFSDIDSLLSSPERGEQKSMTKDDDRDCGSPVQVRISRDLSRPHNHRERMYPSKPPPIFTLSSKNIGYRNAERTSESPPTTKQPNPKPKKTVSTSVAMIEEEIAKSETRGNLAWQDQKKHQYLFTEVELFLNDEEENKSWDTLPPRPPPVMYSKRK
jgi:chromosome segregation ATPase